MATFSKVKDRWYFWPVVIFLSSRLIYGAMLALAARKQQFQVAYFPKDVPGRASYLDLVANWDSFWYFSIAAYGYPDTIEKMADGNVEQTAWAFFPLWPGLLRITSEITSLPLVWCAAILAPLLALGGVLFLYKMVENLASNRTALFAVLWVSFFPASAVFQIAYTESLAFLLLTASFYLISKKSYYWALLPITLLAFTRPITIAVAGTLIVFWLYLHYRDRKGTYEFSKRERISLALVALYAGASFAFFPLYCALVLNRWDGFLYAQSAWKDYGAGNYFGYLINNFVTYPLPTIVFTACFASIIFMLVKLAWPALLKIWVIVYILYLALALPIAFHGSGYEFVSEEKGEFFVLNYSLFRYYLLALMPLAPVHLIWKINSKSLRIASFALLAFITLALAWLYISQNITRQEFFAFP